jgi:ribosomal protein S18 acetylase RimI-like enzyme
MVRKFRPADAARLKDITVTCFDGVSIDQGIERLFGEVAGHDWKWRKAADIQRDVDANPDGIFVWEEAGVVAGYITTRVDHESGIGWIPNIATDPAYQGQGIGRALMAAALDYLRSEGMRLAKIETLQQNAIGQAFYPSVGFREITRQIHYALDLTGRQARPTQEADS